MKNEVFDYYNDNVSAKGLIFKHIKGWYYVFCTSSVLFGVSSVIIFFLFRESLLQGITFFVFISLFITSICVFNYRTKKLLSVKYNIIHKKFMWYGSEFQLLRKKKFKEYLITKSLLSTSNIKTLIEIYTKDADGVKVNIPVIPSIFAVLFIPLWNNLLNWIFKQNDIITLDQSLEIFWKILLIILMATGFFMMVKGSFWPVLEDIINSKYYKMKNLCKLLEEIKFDLELGIESELTQKDNIVMKRKRAH